MKKKCRSCGRVFEKPQKISLTQWASRLYCSYACARREHGSKIAKPARSRADYEPLFWSKVIKSEGCWTWTGARHPAGYGTMRINGRNIRATHVSWEIATGSRPKLWILHKCDNPACVRPDHLQEGDHAENMRQMVARGRSLKNRVQWRSAG